ncbi:asparagine synthetase B family protein [Massilia sp. RP-1-19]|uniref:asparagine synthase (glutamine-hydrolyzing) n=1 Tax=Massilia polaris TaxID=2728846 RepID=A0A848HKE3_9BURK|nr:asparagine synthetase B family protein [Massilia polaris]NML61602.1 asparagine synthetase B family protein [Massilia polaris]
MNESIFRVKRRAEGFETLGSAQCALGHQIARESGPPDGIYAEWNWDGKCLTARNDRYGMFPAFYYSRDGEFAISSCIDRLLEAGADPALDEKALSVFFRLGFFIGEDTPFRHIRALPPGATLQWDGELRLERTPRARGIPSRGESRTSSLDTYNELFRQSMARRAPVDADFAVPLSGGRDSRHILFELLRQGHRPGRCITALHFPPRGNEDARIATMLTQEFGLKHDIIAQTGSFYDAEAAKNPLTSYCTDEHAWYMEAASNICARERVVYDGIAGDVLSQSVFLNEARLRLFQSASPNAIATRLLDKGEKKLRSLLTPQLYRSTGLDLAIAHLEAEVKTHLDKPNPVGSFFFWNRTRREIALAPYGLLGDVPTVYAPFLDHDLYDYLAGLPAEMLLDHTFHSDTISRAYPEYAHLPYEDKDKLADTPDLVKLHAQFGTRVAKRLLLRPSSRLISKRFALPRAVRSLFSSAFGASTHWYSPLALYLDQLDTATRR